MSGQATSIAKAATEAFMRPLGQSMSHQPVAGDAPRLFVLNLWRRHQGKPRGPGEAALPAGELDALVHQTIEGTQETSGTKSDPAELRKMLADLHCVVVPEGDGHRLSERRDLSNPAAFGGLDIARAPTPETALRMFAHNHLLVFPEMYLVLRSFGPLGAIRASAKRLAGQFSFCRKLNAANTDICISDLVYLQILRPDGNRLKAPPPLPPCATAAYIAEAALQVSGYSLDTQFSTSAVLSMLSAWMGNADQTLRSNKVHESLGSPEPILRFEVGGSHARMTRTSFLWLVQHGIVDPLSAGRVLKTEGDAAGIAEMGKGMIPHVVKNSPSNVSDYNAVFGRQAEG